MTKQIGSFATEMGCDYYIVTSYVLKKRGEADKVVEERHTMWAQRYYLVCYCQKADSDSESFDYVPVDCKCYCLDKHDSEKVLKQDGRWVITRQKSIQTYIAVINDLLNNENSHGEQKNTADSFDAIIRVKRARQRT